MSNLVIILKLICDNNLQSGKRNQLDILPVEVAYGVTNFGQRSLQNLSDLSSNVDRSTNSELIEGCKDVITVKS